MWYLNICFPNGKTREFDLSRGEVIIGRAADCGLVLDDISISRYHAKISIGNIGVSIEDMQSSNGILVNGHIVVDKVILRAGDEILLGNVKLNLLVGEDEERTVLFQPQREAAAEAPPVMTEKSPEQVTPPKPYKPPNEATDVVEMSGLRINKDLPSGNNPAQTAEESTKITSLSEGESSPGNSDPEEFIPKLLIFMEGEPQNKYPLYRDHINIGRAEDNDIIIDHGSISRFHAKLTLSEGNYTLVDLGSANGTKVNGAAISKVVMKNWDEVYFGSVRAKFAGKPNSLPDPPQVFGEKNKKPRHLILLVSILILLIALLLFIMAG